MGIGEKKTMYSFGEIRMRSCSSSERTGRGMGEAQLFWQIYTCGVSIMLSVKLPGFEATV